MAEQSEVTLRWRGEGKVASKVEVAGDFNSWIPSPLESQEDGSWLAKLPVAPGKYQYKFVVDGDWVVNRVLPVVTDLEGNENNQLEVDEEEGSGGDSDSWEKVSIPETAEDKVVVGEKISVVERVFSLNMEDTIEMIKDNDGKLVEEKKYTDIYHDTGDFILLRKGMWLRERLSEEQSCWQVRRIDQEELLVTEGEEETRKKLEEVLGEQFGEDLKVVVGERMREMVRIEGSRSKWLVGTTEVEVRKEGEVETALVRVVGDIVAALKDLETSANRLKLLSFTGEIAANLTGAA